jgi:ribosomal protein S26
VLARYNDNAYKIDLPRDKYNVSDIFNVKDLSPFHGDEELDLRTNLPQRRGDDAEHPKAIPMDPTTSTTTQFGPMTRARARALETEVTSLLSHFHFDTMRHGYYLIRILCACSGTMGKLRSKEKRKRKMNV